MLVLADGRTVGTIGGGCYENDAFWKAREAITSGKSSLLHYELNDDFAQENGLICGGHMDVHIDPLLPAPRLYIVGAGHVGWHLAKSRPTPASTSTSSTIARSSRTPSAFPAPRSSCEPIPEWLHRADLPPSAYVVVVTRGHTHDLDAMRALAARDLKYLGLIGSRAKVARIWSALLAEGMPPECLEPRARPDRARHRRRHARRRSPSASWRSSSPSDAASTRRRLSMKVSGRASNR